MQKKKMRESRVEKLLGGVFFAAGFVMLLIVAIFEVYAVNYKAGALKVEGTVEAVGSGTDVSYIYNGESLTAHLTESSSNTRPRDSITLYVDKENPHKVKSSLTFLIFPLVFGCVGVPFLGIGIGFLIAVGVSGKKRKDLLVNGRKLYAEVTGGRINYSQSVNGRHPSKLECRYADPVTGEEYHFSSRNVWFDPELYVGQQVTVYVKQDDYSKYYVDISGLDDSNIHDFR